MVNEVIVIGFELETAFYLENNNLSYLNHWEQKVAEQYIYLRFSPRNQIKCSGILESSIETIKQNQLGWLGYVQRMNQDRLGDAREIGKDTREDQ